MEHIATSGTSLQLADIKPRLSVDDKANGIDHINRLPPKARQRSRRKNNSDGDNGDEDSSKRRCVSTACIACRKRKSKCDGNTPACAACSQVYGTECVYDPNSDHRRKGVYKNDIDNLKTRNSTLQTLIQAILNSSEEDCSELVREIRTCESLDTVAERIVAKENGIDLDEENEEPSPHSDDFGSQGPTFETQLYGKMGDLRLDAGSIRYIGGTSNLIHLAQEESGPPTTDDYLQRTEGDPITSWTTVSKDPELIRHLLNMYFTWHYTYFATLSKKLFYEDFNRGAPRDGVWRKHAHCSSLLVNAILALGCHFTSHSAAREIPDDSTTAGDHFFKEAKRLIMDNDEHEKPALTTVQALALMSVREAGCGREAKGWVYSGMSFRMACDMGLNLDSAQLTTNRDVSGDEAEEDARRITFWGCYLFDKCWSNYLGRLPQLPTSIATIPKFDVFPDEDAAQWSPYTDSGFTQAHTQPARTRAVARQISKLCEISNDLMKHFYNPTDLEKAKGKFVELRKLSDIHTRLEAWRRELPKEMEPREGGLSSVLVMHMFFQLLFIHLFRPFLKYQPDTSPLPATVSPRKLCTQAAAMISKLMRLYKRSHGLRQICNIAVYIAHSACTIHLLNLPDKNAKRDIVHGVKHLEEIAEGWLGARRTLGILSFLARKWNVDLPEEAASVLKRTDKKFGAFQTETQASPTQSRRPSEAITQLAVHHWQNGNNVQQPIGYQAGGSILMGPPGSSANGYVTGRRPSMPPPPQDANGMRAWQQPSANTTPDTRRGGKSYNSESTAGNSPSDIFGGVDQLIREGQNWTYKDQENLATGFENWNASETDPASWNGHVMQMNQMPVQGNGGNAGSGGAHHLHNTATPAGHVVPQEYVQNAAGLNDGSVAMANWLNRMTYSNIRATMYNEDEWYQ